MGLLAHPALLFSRHRPLAAIITTPNILKLGPRRAARISLLVAASASVCDMIPVASTGENHAMKIFNTIALAFGVIIAGLVCLSSSTCAVSSGMDPSTRVLGAIFAICSLTLAIGGVMRIAGMNRKE